MARVPATSAGALGMSDMMRSRTIRYALSGAVLALGAPLGWMAIQVLVTGMSSFDLLEELRTQMLLYGYLLGATAAAFIAFGAVLGNLSDRHQAKMTELVATDGLTSLKNKAYFDERIRTECARAQREDRPLALILADLDYFKSINDRWGHLAGDDALALAARLIASSIRAGDVACRIGGEEFAIVCPGANLEEGAAVAERIRSNIAASPLRGPNDVQIAFTVSLGLAAYRPGRSQDVLRSRADQAMYLAKRNGRNQVRTESDLDDVPVMPPAGSEPSPHAPMSDARLRPEVPALPAV